MPFKQRRNLIDKFLISAFSLYKKINSALSRSDNRIAARIYLQARSLERSIVGRKYSFITVDELMIWTTEWIKTFPISYDLIVGIPRSGLFVANLIALKLGKPFTTPELFCRANYWGSKLINKKGEFKNILLVDDSITNGKSLEESLELLRPYCEHLNITKAVLIATEYSKTLVDSYYQIIPHPRVFEWNLLHAKKGKLVSDMDGVICENCPPSVDINEKLYIEWIRNAKPYLIPTFEIDAIVSCRLEKYRFETEEWLANHGIRYRELILWNIKSKQERNGKYSKYKIKYLIKIKPDMVWESSFSQAKQIWESTKIPTLCTDEMILLS